MEVRLVTADGTVHRVFEDETGLLYKAEGDNLEQSQLEEGWEIVRPRIFEGEGTALASQPFLLPEGARYCQRCLKGESQ